MSQRTKAPSTARHPDHGRFYSISRIISSSSDTACSNSSACARCWFFAAVDNDVSRVAILLSILISASLSSPRRARGDGPCEDSRMKHATGRPAALARCITSCNSSGAKRISFVEVRRSRVARFPFEPELRNGEPPEDGIDRGGISELGHGSLQRKYLPIVGGVLFLARAQSQRDPRLNSSPPK